MEKKKLFKILKYIAIIITLLIIILSILVLIKYYVGTPEKVYKSSMYPTLQEGEWVWVNKWFKTTNDIPKRGDLITFPAPNRTELTEYNINVDNPVAFYIDMDPIFKRNSNINFWDEIFKRDEVTYLKRVIALPGEHVEIKEGKVYIDGEILQEEYLQDGIQTNVERKEINKDNIISGYDNFVVPENCIFAMGDNRESSIDCRNFGCIPIEKITGKVTNRIFPLSKFGNI